MISFLGEPASGSNATMWVLLGLLVVLIVMFVISMVKRKKYNQETADMLNTLKPGDKVKTYSGFYGTVVSITETTDGKVVTLETGDDKHKSYTTIDSNAIYCLDKKEDIVYDAEGNIVLPVTEEDKKEVLENTKDVVEVEKETKKEATKKKKSKVADTAEKEEIKPAEEPTETTTEVKEEVVVEAEPAKEETKNEEDSTTNK